MLLFPVGPRVCFILVMILISMFLRYCICELGIFHAERTAGCLGAGAELGRGVVGHRLVEPPPPSGFVAGRPSAAPVLVLW